MPVLQHFADDITREEHRVTESHAVSKMRSKQLQMKRQLKYKCTKRLLKQSKRYVVRRRLKRNLTSFEAKLQAIGEKFESLKRTARESTASVEACRQLFTEKGKELLRGPLRTSEGAYSEAVRQFASQMHYTSPKAYAHLRRFFRLPAASTIRQWNRFD